MNEIYKNNIDSEENNENYITLTDDTGEDIHFEVIDEFEFGNKNYIVLIPFEDVEDEVVILEVIYSENDDDNEYLSIDDDQLLSRVFEEFKKRNSEIFNFED